MMVKDREIKQAYINY